MIGYSRTHTKDKIRYIIKNRMEQNETTAIVKRFFEALQTLKENGLIGGLQTFTRRYGLDRRNVQHLRVNLESGTFKAGWLTYLVNDFHVSATWLLTGRGTFWQYGWDAEKAKKCNLQAIANKYVVQTIDNK